MPFYEYRCDNGHTFEVMQRMSDDPVAVCNVCGDPVQRVFHPVAVHFKGSGFYTTDYGKQRRSSGGGEESSSSSDGGATSKTEKKGETTTSSTSSTSSD